MKQAFLPNGTVFRKQRETFTVGLVKHSRRTCETFARGLVKHQKRKTHYNRKKGVHKKGMTVQIITMLVTFFLAVELVALRLQLKRIVRVINEYLDSVMNTPMEGELTGENEVLKKEEKSYINQGFNDYRTIISEQEKTEQENAEKNRLVYRVLEEIFP